MSAQELFGEKGTIGFGQSGQPKAKINSINNHPVGRFLGHWYNFLTDNFRPSSGFHADLVDDSLTNTSESLGAACLGVVGQVRIAHGHGCCHPSRSGPCKEGAGNCYNDTECVGNLLCGHNNCDLDNPGFRYGDDCCYWPGNIYKSQFFCVKVNKEFRYFWRLHLLPK